MIRTTSLGALAILACGLITLQAQAPLTISGAWVREPVPGRPATAAYATLENTGATDLQIVSASTDAAGAVELHEMVRSGDMMRMSPVKSVRVPARGTVELKPGGLHIMLFQLKRPLAEGDAIELTLTTDTGRTVKTTAAVRKGRVAP